MLSVPKLNAIFCDEEKTVRFMQDHGLLPSEGEIARCKKCDGDTKIYYRTKILKSEKKRKIPAVRCVVRGCQTYRSIREYNKFFTSVGSNNRCNSNLTLGAILQILLYWCLDCTVELTALNTTRNQYTVAHWFSMCRKICVHLFDERTHVGGTGARVQINEILLEKKKNRRDRENSTVDEPNSTATARIFCMKTENDSTVPEQRFFFVKQRDCATFTSIIEKEILPGTTILSDIFESCTHLQSLGYNCSTLHDPEYTPNTGMSPRAIKTTYPVLKMKNIRQTYNINRKSLQSQLAEAWYRSTIDKDDNPFVILLRHIKNIYRE